MRADLICVSPAARDVSPDFTRFAIAGQTAAADAAFAFVAPLFPELLIDERAEQQASIDALRTGAAVVATGATSFGGGVPVAIAAADASPEGAAAAAAPLGAGSAATVPAEAEVDTGMATGSGSLSLHPQSPRPPATPKTKPQISRLIPSYYRPFPTLQREGLKRTGAGSRSAFWARSPTPVRRAPKTSRWARIRSE